MSNSLPGKSRFLRIRNYILMIVMLLAPSSPAVFAQEIDTGAERIGLSVEDLLSINENRALFSEPSSGYNGISCSTNGTIKSAPISGWTRSELTTLVDSCPLTIHEIHEDGSEYYLIGRMQGPAGVTNYLASFDTNSINQIVKIDAFNIESIDLLDSSLTSLYWADQNQLRKIDKDGLALSILDQADDFITAIDYYNGFIYYTVYPGAENGNIRRVRADGQGLPETVKESVVPGVAFELEVNDTGMYIYGFEGGVNGENYIARFSHTTNTRDIIATRNVRENGEAFIPSGMLLLDRYLLYSENNPDSSSLNGTNVWLTDTSTLNQEQIGSYLGSENARIQYAIGTNFYWSAVIEFGQTRNTAVFRDEFPTGVNIQANNSSRDSSGCFIATAAYGSYLHPHVKVLRNFRDNVLLRYSAGEIFVDMYYRYSPAVAEFIAKSDILKFIVRTILTPIILLFIHTYLALILVLSIGTIITYRKVSKR